MEFEISERFDPEVGDTVIEFRGRIKRCEVVPLQLDAADKALLANVGQADDTTAADHLLALEMLYRRSAEQQ